MLKKVGFPVQQNHIHEQEEIADTVQLAASTSNYQLMMSLQALYAQNSRIFPAN